MQPFFGFFYKISFAVTDKVWYNDEKAKISEFFMKNRRGMAIFIVAVMIISFLPIFTACGLEYPYEDFSHIGFTEPYANKAVVLKGKKVMLGENAVYLDDCYSDGTKEELLNLAEKAFDRFPSSKPLTMYVGENFSSRTDGENLYLGTSDPAVFLHTYLQLLGDKALNYGLLWGVSEHLRAELEGDSVRADDKKAKEYLAENPSLIEMEAPLFYAPFSEEKEIKQAKTVSVSFAEWLYGKEGEKGVRELLEKNLAALHFPLDGNLVSDFSSAFTDKKNAYLRELGVDFSAEEQTHFFRYAPFTVKYPLEIGTEWGKLYIRGDYYAEENKVVHDYCYESYSAHDYGGLKDNLLLLDETAETLLDAFSLEMKGVPDYVWFLDQDTHLIFNYGGILDWYAHTGKLSNLCEFPHEFTHAIEAMLGVTDSIYDYPWLIEGVADYAALTLAPKLDFANFSMEKDLQSSAELQGLYDKLRPTSESDLHAWKDAQAVWSVLNGYHIKNDNYSYYFRYCSFVYYLVEQIGWESFSAFLKTSKSFYPSFGATQYELWNAWANSLFARAGEGAAPSDFAESIR